MKDLDGARTVEFEAIGGSVFMWGVGFSYEFDRGLFTHQIKRVLGTSNAEGAPWP